MGFFIAIGEMLGCLFGLFLGSSDSGERDRTSDPDPDLSLYERCEHGSFRSDYPKH